MKGKVLIVEDYEDWRDLLSGLLRREGHVVTAVATLDEARKHVDRTKDLDLAIVDIRLVETDKNNEGGMHLLAHIKKKQAFTRVIMITGHGTMETQRKAFREFQAFDFFRKEQIGIIILFLLLYRLSEAQLVKLAAPFFLDKPSAGGLGLTTAQIGLVYGTIGVIFLVLGGILGGFAIARNGLKFWLLPMVISINIPNVVYWLFALFHTTSLAIVSVGVAFEQFGYGFGFAAYLFYAMMISEGKYKTAHYAIATGFMALGMMLPGMFSGFLQESLGYSNFFLWVVFSSLPMFILIKYVKINPDYGKK